MIFQDPIFYPINWLYRPFFIQPIVAGIGLLLFAGALVYAFVRKDFEARRRLRPLIFTLPLVCVLADIGGFAIVSTARSPAWLNPDWFSSGVMLAPYLPVIVGGFFFWRLAGQRLFTAAYALFNAFLAGPVAFLATVLIVGLGS